MKTVFVVETIDGRICSIHVDKDVATFALTRSVDCHIQEYAIIEWVWVVGEFDEIDSIHCTKEAAEKAMEKEKVSRGEGLGAELKVYNVMLND